MKKKFFSKLLMGALLVATVSSYVSCKDYDDDIANLQSQIAAQEQAHALKTELESAKSEAAANLAAAEARLQALIDGKASAADLSAAKSELEAAIAGVKATAEKAGTDVATALEDASKAQTAAEGAQLTADAALAAAKAADEKIDAAVAAATTQLTAALEGKADKAATDAAIASVNAELAKLGEAQKSLATADDLSKAVADLEKKIQAVTDAADLSGYVARLTALEEGIQTLWSAVTSVSLYVTSTQDKYGDDGHHALYPITFLKATEMATVKFPEANAELVDGQLSFTEKNNIVKNVDTILVRVSPVTAQLEAGMVTLINSQGVEISKDLIESIEVEPYTELLTRAASNNGLWKVYFKVKGNYESDAFEKIAGEEGKEVLFAVAVNNTKDNAAERRVISEYDLYLREGEIEHVTDFDVTVKTGTYSINEIHNRYWRTEEQNLNTGYNKDIAISQLGSGEFHTDELEWKDQSKPVAENKIVLTGNSQNAGDRMNRYDDRQSEDLLNVEIGEDIIIEFPEEYTPGTSKAKQIRGWFVTLDYNFAIESGKSEINAWAGYTYENVGVAYINNDGKLEVKQKAKLFETSTGTIKIKSIPVNGDVVGFRVYAVNYDGTLYDPDGRAFYVYVGEKQKEEGLPTAEVKLDKTNRSADITIPAGTFESGINWEYEWAEGNPKVWDGSNSFVDAKTYNVLAMFGFSYKDRNNTPKGSYPTNDATKVTVSISNPNYLIDNATYKVVAVGKKVLGNNEVATVARITISITKTMPSTTAMPASFTPKTDMDKSINPLLVYVKPKGTGNTWSANINKTSGTLGEDIWGFKLGDIFNGVDENYKFTVQGNGEKSGNNYNNDPIVAPNWELPTVHPDKLGAVLGVKAEYNYGPITLTANNDGTPKQGDYIAKVDNPFTLQYANALDLSRIATYSVTEWGAKFNKKVNDSSTESNTNKNTFAGYSQIKYGQNTSAVATVQLDQLVGWKLQSNLAFFKTSADFDTAAGLPIAYKDAATTVLSDLVGNYVSLTVDANSVIKEYFTNISLSGTTVTLSIKGEGTAPIPSTGITGGSLSLKFTGYRTESTVTLPLTIMPQ